MSREVRITIKQSVFDIAIQKCGSIDAVFDIAELNGLSVTDQLEAGQVLLVPDAIEKPIADYYKSKGLVPATDLLEEGIGDLMDDGIDFMAIQVDNIVT